MRNIPGKFVLAALAAACVFAFTPAAHAAESFAETLRALADNHKQIKAAEADLEKAKEEAEAAWGDWYPEFSFTGSYGYEKQRKGNFTQDTEQVPREVDFTITQMLWDFGATNSAIRSARLSVDRSLSSLISTRQALILQGIEAHVNVIRANKVVGFADGSVANIKRQAELEDARVQRGGGFTTDVLQAKTQLAGAEARRNNFAAGLRSAINGYRRFFGKEPGKIDAMQNPRVPFEMLPKTLDDLLKIMLENNPALEQVRIDAAIESESVTKTRADEFFPSLSASAEAKRKLDVGGTIGTSFEKLIKVELTYDINLGLTEPNTLRAAKQGYLAATDRYIDAMDSFEEQTRNLWSNFARDQSNAEFLKNQANIAGEFLELARRERQLGKRSLIDVLAGETALINANSDATAAESDVVLDVFRIVSIMGQLEADVVK